MSDIEHPDSETSAKQEVCELQLAMNSNETIVQFYVFVSICFYWVYFDLNKDTTNVFVVSFCYDFDLQNPVLLFRASRDFVQVGAAVEQAPRETWNETVFSRTKPRDFWVS